MYFQASITLVLIAIWGSRNVGDSFPFYEEFVVACAYTQDVKFVRNM
jgi:hypothetical protein